MTDEWFIKNEFEIYPFCSSRFVSNNGNCLSRLQITIANGINAHVTLPEYMIFVLDDDLIQFLEYKSWGVASLYGPWLEWLLQSVQNLVDVKWKQLPNKARLPHKPQIY